MDAEIEEVLTEPSTLNEEENAVSIPLITDQGEIIIELKNFLRNVTDRALSYEHIDTGLALKPGSTERYIEEAAKEMGLTVKKGETIFELVNKS
jgi:glyoxylate utilization-related uncharacterized protein